MTSIKTLSRVNVTITGARGPVGIEIDGPLSPGQFLVKSPGVNRRYQGASGTGADAGLRTDLAANSGSGLVGARAPGTGAVATSIEDELFRRVYVDQYGAKGDYSPTTGTGTNDTPAFLKAIAALGGAGTIIIPRGFRCLIGTSLALPNSVKIEAESGRTFMAQDGLDAGSGDLYISSTASITLGSASGIVRCVVFRQGIQFDITSAQVTSTFLGTAFILRNYTFDHTFEDCVIGGFLNGIASQSSTLGASCDRTRIIGRLSMDCINCIRLYNAYDVPILDGLHCWPFITFKSPAEANGAQFKRSGYAVWLHGVNDWSKIQNAFNYGYKVGYRVTDARSVTLINCGSDYPFQSAPDASAGFIIEGAAAEARLIGCQAAQRDSGIYIASTSPLLAVEIISPNIWECRVNCVAVAQGDVQIIGGSMSSAFAGCNGVETASGAGEVSVTGTDFRNLNIALANANANVSLTHRGCTFRNVSMVASNPYVARAVAATPMDIPKNAKGTVVVSGNAAISLIGQNDCYAGQTLTLVFTGTPTILSGGSNLRNMGTDFVAAPDKQITFASTGTYWVEVSRK